MRALLLVFTASIIAVAACGARTSLRDEQSPGLSTEPLDAGLDVIVDDGLDASEDPDVIVLKPDTGISDCQDAGTTAIYLISSENQLVRFYPPDLSVTTIGTIKCPTSPMSSGPSSMAVDRDGVAYVRFGGSELFRVSTRTASCKPTGFVLDPNRFSPYFGMGFSANAGDPGETFYVASDDVSTPGAKSALARIDPVTFELSVIGPLSKPIGDPELTGTSDARLFAFGQALPLSHLAEIDKTTAAVKSDVLINLTKNAFGSWAFAFWGGDFYFFTSDEVSTSSIHRYTPGGSTTPPLIAKIALTIVGAGVSTCAPSE